MSGETWAFLGVVLAATIAGTFGLLQVLRTNHTTDRTTDRTANLAELQAVNTALRAEIDRVRDDWREDVRELRQQVDDLREEMTWMRRDRADQLRRDHARSIFDRAMVAWVTEWLPRARGLGLEVPDPPEAPNLSPLMDAETLEHPPLHRRWTDRTPTPPR